MAPPWLPVVPAAALPGTATIGYLVRVNGAPSRSDSLLSPAQALSLRLPSLIAAYRHGTGAAGGATSGFETTLAAGALSRKEIAELGESLRRLQRGLTSDRRLSGREGGEGYMDSTDLLGAYLLYYWPVSYLETYLSLRFGNFEARRVLDLGSGPGPAAAAFADASGTRDFLLADGSRAALDLAGRLLGPGIALQTIVGDFERPGPMDEGTFDAIVASHLLNELWKDKADRLERRVAFIEGQARQLEVGGFILVIEPATLAASRELLALRDALAIRGWSIRAPCPSSKACPMLAAGEGRSCHGEAAWAVPEPMASLAAAAGLDRTSVKWSFFIASPKGAPDAPTTYEQGGQILSAGRVVSEGLLNKAGRRRFVLCSGASLVSLSAKAGSSIEEGTGFSRLRRYDLVAARGIERREGGFGLVEGSVLTIEPAPLIAGTTTGAAAGAATGAGAGISAGAGTVAGPTVPGPGKDTL